MLKTPVLLLLCVCCLVPPVFGDIRIRPQIQTSVDDNALNVSVVISNVGNEDVLSVFPEITFHDQPLTLKPVPYIAFEGSAVWSCRFPIQAETPIKGTYPLLMRLNYQDGNKYPFSTVTALTVTVGNANETFPAIAKFQVQAQGEKNSIAKLALGNPQAYGISGRYRIFSPLELDVDHPEGGFSLSEHQQREVVFELHPKGALPESRHTIYGIVEFDGALGHMTQITSDTVTVPASEEGNNIRYQVLGSIMFILALFFATLVVELRKSKVEK